MGDDGSKALQKAGNLDSQDLKRRKGAQPLPEVPDQAGSRQLAQISERTEMPDEAVRWERVLAIRTRIQCGNYAVGAADLAGRAWRRPAALAALLADVYSAGD